MNIPRNEEHAEAYMAEVNRKHAEWLAKPLTFAEWLDLLHRCQDGFATCMYVAKKIEADLDAAAKPKTPNPTLQPLDPTAPKRKMLIEIEVAADFEKRLDNQWMVEREINADRWSWRWADEVKSQ